MGKKKIDLKCFLFHLYFIMSQLILLQDVRWAVSSTFAKC